MNKGRTFADCDIHPSAIIHPGTEIGKGVTIGPFCHIGANVSLKDGVNLVSHVSIEGTTSIGEGTQVYPFTTLGSPPQHTGYRGEETELQIGANCVIREQTSIHRGTPVGGGRTVIGDNSNIMAAAHIGHDVQIGKNVIVASNCSLAGHVEIQDNVFLGGLAGVHQFCRIGANSIIGGCAAVTSDVIPFGSAVGNHAELAGLNIVGMKRAGLDRDTIQTVRNAFRDLFLTETETFLIRLDGVATRYAASKEVMMIVDFLRKDAKRPILAARH